MTDTTTLPLSPTAFWLIVILVGIAFATTLAVATKRQSDMPTADSTWFRFLTRVGLKGVPPTTALFVSVFWAILALTLAGGILATIAAVPAAFTASTVNPDDTTLRWTLLTLTALTGALGAVVALPFTLIRIRQTQRQTDLQDEALFNDKINAAATDLAARRQVTRIIGRGAKTQVLTEWEDDLVTRAAAIDRLEGLALERADVAPRIARMLSIYVQELSRDHPPELAPEKASPDDLRRWARGLRPVRPDMERAVQSLGRINPQDEADRAAFGPQNIDLRLCNLQGFDLNDRNFQGAQLGAASLQGANLGGAKLQGANLFGAKLQGANLRGAKLQRANLGGAKLQGAELTWAKLQGANLFGAELQWANLGGAELQGANLGGAELQGANLGGAKLQGAELTWAELSESTDLTGASLRGVAVRSVDDTILARLQAHDDWDEMFYLAEPLNYDDFISKWRTFAAALDPPVTIRPDYNP